MAVRRIRPIDLPEGEALPTPPRNTHPHYYRLEDYLSFDEVLWRAEARQAKQHAEAFDALRDVTQCVLKIVPMLQPREGANSLKLSKHLKNLERAAASIGKLNPTNLTLEMERALFVWSLASSIFEYRQSAVPQSTAEEDVMAVARYVANHYWAYAEGSVLSSNGAMDIEIAFIDPDDEVGTLMTAEKLTAPQARVKIMDRAVHAVRVHKDRYSLRTSLIPHLKAADPTRFKNVTKLGVIPPPPSDDDTSDDDTADEEA